MFQRDVQKFSPSVFHETPEGYLTGKLCVTGAGVFRYLGDSGKFVGRLRSVDEVKKATETINCKPVTLQHPNQPVTIDNVSDLQVGMSANDASFDGLNNWVTVTVTDKNAVDAIKSGKVKAISMGYKCSINDNVGVWQGSKHEQEQRDMVYNHIALVREGRAGDQVKFMVGDSAEFEDVFDMAELTTEKKETEKLTTSDGTDKSPKQVIINDKNVEPIKTQEQSMKTIQLDGVDYQADEKVIEALQASQSDAAEKLNEIHTLLDGVSELEAKVADLEEQLKNNIDEIDETVIDSAVNAKLEILDVARAAGIECEVSDDVSDLKRKVIGVAFDGIDLESIEDEASINAMFASANKVIADRAEMKDNGDCGKGGKKNPATQFDGARKNNDDNMNDSAEDRLQKRMVELSNGIKKEA